MYYHETLDVCLRSVKDSGFEINDDLLLVRDASGRLTVCIQTKTETEGLAKHVRASLGSYAATPAIIIGHLARHLIADPAAIKVQHNLDGMDVYFRYIDRRIVGADWLAGPFGKTAINRNRVVFASLKGGVGRTTALAVAAAHYARLGLRVLAIDLDLEAPGIGSMLLQSNSEERDQLPKFGVIDYLLESQISGVGSDQLIEYIGKSAFSEGFIDVIPAVGRETERRPLDFIPKLSRAITESITNGQTAPFYQKVCELVNRFEEYGRYDLVLIDARAGIAEITASPLMTLGAQVLLFATDQIQTFSGYAYLLAHMSGHTDFSNLDKQNDWRSHLTFVHSKAPSTENRRSRFRAAVYDLCADWLYESDETDAAFNYSSQETGVFVPHDSTYIKFEQAYEAFDPTLNGEQLDPEVYQGPFGPFLQRLDELIAMERFHADI